MHRTGMVIGVLERCIGGGPMSDIEERFKRHVGWRSASETGGFEPEKAFIAEFDCDLLRRQQRPTTSLTGMA